ncbi:MAG TPA: hypothetical protein VJ982_03475 [Gemmatimonadota bacterium]|nr:hypothetical protein [Gemmatimonadota bacterium]
MDAAEIYVDPRVSVIGREYVERWAAEFATIPGREALPDHVRELRKHS